jgi:predicted transcriptional regulator
MSQTYAFVMMTKEKWWNRFVLDHQEGKKIQSYVQKGLAPPKNGSIILFYVTRPVAQIAGYAKFLQRIAGNPMEIWKKHGNESVLKSEKEYRELVGDKAQVSFVRFQDLKTAVHGVSLVDLLRLLGTKRLSRKGFYTGKETAERIIALME